jgi:hypothetical protein
MSSTTAKTEAQIILDEARQILSRREKVFPPSEVAAFKAHFDSDTNSAAENKENFIDKRKRVYDGPPTRFPGTPIARPKTASTSSPPSITKTTAGSGPTRCGRGMWSWWWVKRAPANRL